MLNAWAKISEKDCLFEIEKSMIKNEIDKEHFTFICFLPVFPPMIKYLLDENAYDDHGWTFDGFKKEEMIVNKQINHILMSLKKA